MNWQSKIKLVAMINEAESFEERKQLRNFINSNLKDFDQQCFGIVVRGLDLKTNIEEDASFVSIIQKSLKKIDINKFSSSEKPIVYNFLLKTKSINLK